MGRAANSALVAAIASLAEGVNHERLLPAHHFVRNTNRGTAYEESGEDTLGLADLDQAIRLDEKFARAYAVRGVISLKRRQDAAAQQDFAKAFQLDPALHGEFDPIIKQLRERQ
ncbi:MAG: hypothetical protein ABI698_01980 [bacterium]